MGRPAFADEDKRHPIAVRFTDGHIQMIQVAAAAEGVSRSEFMRQAVERAAERVVRKMQQEPSEAA